MTASASPLTRLERNLDSSPSSAAPNSRNTSIATTQLSTASPRNSSRSLCGPPALRCVSAASSSAGSRHSYPSASRCHSTALFTCRLGADHGRILLRQTHCLVEVDRERDVADEGRVGSVSRTHRVAVADAFDLDLLRIQAMDVFDGPAPVQGRQQLARTGHAVGMLFGGLLHRPH